MSFVRALKTKPAILQWRFGIFVWFGGLNVAGQKSLDAVEGPRWIRVNRHN